MIVTIPPRLLVPMLALALAGLACGGGSDTTERASAPESTPTQLKTDAVPKAIPVKAKAVMDARWSAKKLEKTVHVSVLKAVERDGAAESLGVCVDSKVASEIQKLKGAKVGRASLKLRNPDNAGPDWVREFLATEDENPPEVDLKSITNIVEVEGGEVARFLRRIKLEEGCLACHGDPAAMAPEVVAALKAKYPDDKAVGYAAGAMRGVVWAEAPVAKEPPPAPR